MCSTKTFSLNLRENKIGCLKIRKDNVLANDRGAQVLQLKARQLVVRGDAYFFQS